MTSAASSRPDPQTQDIPVIFVSALSEMGDEAEGFEAGGVDYIIKPVRAPIVRARVRTHLSLVQNRGPAPVTAGDRAAPGPCRRVQRQRNWHARAAA